MVIKHTISITIRGSIPNKVSAKSFLAEVANRFTKSDKVKAVGPKALHSSFDDDQLM